MAVGDLKFLSSGYVRVPAAFSVVVEGLAWLRAGVLAVEDSDQKGGHQVEGGVIERESLEQRPACELFMP